MTTSKPKTEAFLVTSTDEDLHEMRGVQLMEHHDPSCVNTQFRYEPLIRLSDYEALQAECDALREALFEAQEALPFEPVINEVTKKMLGTEVDRIKSLLREGGSKS